MTALARVVDALASTGFTVTVDAPFGELTTYGVGGRCAALVEVSGSARAVAVAETVASCGPVRTVVLGNGSNTLVSDEGFDGLVVRLVPSRNPADFEVKVLDGSVTADGWMPLPVLARRAVAAGGCGLEWAVGVPGTVGGAVRMNAGGHGAETVDSLESAQVVSLASGRSEVFAAGDLGLHFRGSALGDTHLVVCATFAVRDPAGHDCAAELAGIVSWRRANQPGGHNAGSVFVNPAPGEGSSGALIDAAGMRGHRVGGAAVSDKHANFIQASEGATASDIVAVMSDVQDAVRNTHGVVLRSEVRMVGFGEDVVARFAAEGHADGPVIAAAAAIARRLGETP